MFSSQDSFKNRIISLKLKMVLDGIPSREIFKKREAKGLFRLMPVPEMMRELSRRDADLTEEELRKVVENGTCSVFNYYPNIALDEVIDWAIPQRSRKWLKNKAKLFSGDAEKIYAYERRKGYNHDPAPVVLEQITAPAAIVYGALTHAVYMTPDKLHQAAKLDREFFEGLLREQRLVRRRFAGNSLIGISAADLIPVMVTKEPDAAVNIYNAYASAVKPTKRII